MMNELADILGWIGSILLILAYYKNSKKLIDAQSLQYQFLNVLGSLLLIFNTVYYGAYPSSVVNIIWVFIGTHYLIKITKNNGK